MYPGVAPGQDGQTIILGHSAPPGWPNIKYDWVFTKLNLLEPGATISINYGGRAFTYSVTKTIFLDRGGELPAAPADKNVLYSCQAAGRRARITNALR